MERKKVSDQECLIKDPIHFEEGGVHLFFGAETCSMPGSAAEAFTHSFAFFITQERSFPPYYRGYGDSMKLPVVFPGLQKVQSQECNPGHTLSHVLSTVEQ